MPTAPVSDLKARLSEYLKKVRAGSEVLITDRGKPVARLVPLARGQVSREALARQVEEGVIRLGPGKLPKSFWSMPRPGDPDSSVLGALLEERKEGR